MGYNCILAMHKRVLILITALLIPLTAETQESRPLIGLNPLKSQGLNSEETRFLESLIQLYTSNEGRVVYSSTVTPDYFLSTSVSKERSGYIFTLEILDTRMKETSRFTSVHRTSGDLALKLRSIIENSFRERFQVSEGNSVSVKAEKIVESSIAGTWRGEPGIEMIRLMEGGSGTAFFSSGVKMDLRYTIENDILVVTQTSPNTESFYHHLPQGTARQLSARAAPMRWELVLHSGGSRLKGTKISTEVKIEGNTVSGYYSEAKNSNWIKVNR